ncbi:hypothetical protein DM01DRAFT_1382585 [Hesseltinella vesiculosa]|uniref:PHD-type domain-containing protein n=1 Tax=Hesseltinella vesiculosa TaxID=101127 RepID=A0A1X2GLB4_9FUNG|nr:hypothetical protein DM01DRAFT_1382585 [Hesseltinella vesiculosa]
MSTERPLVKLPIFLPKHAERALGKKASATASHSVPPVQPPVDMSALANTVKLRMKAAAHLMALNRSPPLFSITPRTRIAMKPQPRRLTSNVLPRTLKYHALLQQYLSFVETELDVRFSRQDGSHPLHLPSPRPTNQQAKTSASTGAALIEALMHHEDLESNEPDDDDAAFQPTPVSPPSLPAASPNLPAPSPPPSLPCSPPTPTTNKRLIRARLSRPARHRPQPQLRGEKHVRCICQATDEAGHGLMVQCDDCFHWLHLECLELDPHGLQTSHFRCPSCYISLGQPKDHHLSSVIHWRYAAHWKSRRLATRRSQQPCQRRHHHPYRPSIITTTLSAASLASEEEDGDDEEDDDFDTADSPERSWLIPTMTIDAPLAATMLPCSTRRVVVLPCASLSPTADDNVDNVQEEDGMESDTTVDVDWRHGQKSLVPPQPIIITSVTCPDHGPASCSTSQGGSSDSESLSEVSTPTDPIDDPLTEPSDLWAAATSRNNVDEQGLLYVSQMACLESMQLQPKQPFFSPLACDVFLTDPQPANWFKHASNRLPCSELPSSICSQDLPLFAFDDGPFWLPQQ